jgi:hypothetical protein
VTASTDAASGGPAGGLVHWLTTDVVSGHRVRGSQFLVPLAAGNFDSAGTIVNSTVSTLLSAAQALVTACAPDLVVWHRPVGGSGGSQHVVTGASVPDKIVVRRSRRD